MTETSLTSQLTAYQSPLKRDPMYVSAVRKREAENPLVIIRGALVFLAALFTLGAFILSNWSSGSDVRPDQSVTETYVDYQDEPEVVETYNEADVSGWYDEPSFVDDGGRADTYGSPTADFLGDDDAGGWGESALGLQ